MFFFLFFFYSSDGFGFYVLLSPPHTKKSDGGENEQGEIKVKSSPEDHFYTHKKKLSVYFFLIAETNYDKPI